MKKLNFTKRVRATAYALACFTIVAGLAVFSACSDDGDDEPSFEGTYVISSAVLVNETPEKVPLDYLPEGTEEPMKLPAGADVQPIFFGLLATAGPCSDDPSKTAIQLKSNEKVAYICTDDSAAGDETGDWYVSQDGNSLVIIIQSETLPVPVTLTLDDFEFSGNKLTGTLNNFGFFPSVNGPTQPQTVTLNVEFTKIN